MVTKSYNQYYLSYVAENLGTMFDYAASCDYKPLVFWDMFTKSVVAKQIEKGNPRYLIGMSAIDLTNAVINTTHSKGPILNCKQIADRSMYFWTGWALAQLQYQSGKSFDSINKVLPINKVLSLYPTLHEADITKFYDIANKYLDKIKKETNLKIIRKASGLSQAKLAEKSGVELRSIQMYEQKHNDINKAQVETLQKLSKTLGCNIEDLMED